MVLLILICLCHAKGQGTINIASANISNASHSVSYVIGGDLINSISNDAYSVIQSSLSTDNNLMVTEILSENNGVRAFPNPFTDKININLPSVHTIELLDVRGLILQTTSFMNGEVDGSNLPQGMYFIRFYDDKNSTTIKVIKI